MTLNERLNEIINDIPNFYKKHIIIFTSTNAVYANDNSYLYYCDMDLPKDNFGCYGCRGNKIYEFLSLDKKDTIKCLKDDTYGILEKSVNSFEL